ncbi:MAG: ABC transporter permease [Campylobacterota bacterium]|nr:ABC transporter permease [Campylobacterota bacterium]
MTIFTSVISALIMREIQTRFESKKFGYFWALLDAMTLIVGLVFLRGIIMEIKIIGVDVVVFLATSFLAFFLFKNIVNQSMNAFSSNKALFNYQQVKPIDTIISRIIIEVLLSLFATIVLVVIGLYLEFNLSVKNFNMVLLAALWLALFGVSIGIFTAVVASFYQWFSKIVSFLMMPLLFLSALFYTVDSLPPEYRVYILYNPVTHFIEMLHGYYFQTLDTQYVDYLYMTYWTLIPLFLGLYIYIKGERQIVAS